MITPAVIIRLFWSGFSNKGYWKRWGERFGYVMPPAGSIPRIWVHAVSVGEVQAATPLIERLASCYPQYSLLVTTVTPSGSEVVHQKFTGQASHTYLPYDLPGPVNRFLDRVNPAVLIVMETEIWPNLYHYCHERGVDIFLVNCRISEKSFRGYKKLAGLTRKVLSNISMIAAQSHEDANRLMSLGVDRKGIIVSGNIKFDITIPDCVYEQAHFIKQSVSGSRPVWIAASTQDGEEEIVLNAHRKIVDRLPDCLLILAPRHPERRAAIAGLCRNFGFSSVSKTKAGDNHLQSGDEVQVYILDTIGELMAYYAASDVAFVGGSLLPEYGGHNVLEPASLGLPVICGKYTGNFKEINELLCDNKALTCISGNQQLAEKVILLMGDEKLRRNMGQAGRNLVERNSGSLDRTLKMMSAILDKNVSSEINKPGDNQPMLKTINKKSDVKTG